MDNETIELTKFPCFQCGGLGYIIDMGHEPGCMGECKHCPVEIQRPCDTCNGSGYFEQPQLVPKE